VSSLLRTRRVRSEYFHWIGPSIGGVSVDVASELTSQVGSRGEDAGDDLAFDLGEPSLDLVELG
jgi:hypothetical protein